MAVSARDGKEWAPGKGTFALLCAGHGATHFVLGATVFLLPYIRQDAGLSYAQATGLAVMYYAAAFFANCVSGYRVDASGQRVLVQILSVIVAGGGVILAALAGFALDGTPLFVLLAVGWGLSGMGNQAWHPAAFSYLAKHYPEKRSFVFSIHVVAANIGDALFPLIAGILLAHVFAKTNGVEAWESVAIIAGLPCLLIAVVLAVYLVPRDRRINEGKPQGMSARSYFKGYGELLRNKNAMLLALVAGLRNAAQTGLLIFLPFYLVDVFKTSPVMVGVALMLLQVGGMIATPIAGTAADRLGERPVVFACLSLTTVVLVGAMFITDPNWYIASIALMGFALYAIRPVVQSWMMVLVPEEFRGSATSVMFGVQSLMNALILLCAGWLADEYGLVFVFYIIAGIILLANVLTFALPKSAGRKGARAA